MTDDLLLRLRGDNLDASARFDLVCTVNDDYFLGRAPGTLLVNSCWGTRAVIYFGLLYRPHGWNKKESVSRWEAVPIAIYESRNFELWFASAEIVDDEGRGYR